MCVFILLRVLISFNMEIDMKTFQSSVEVTFRTLSIFFSVTAAPSSSPVQSVSTRANSVHAQKNLPFFLASIKVFNTLLKSFAASTLKIKTRLWFKIAPSHYLTAESSSAVAFLKGGTMSEGRINGFYLFRGTSSFFVCSTL